ncbi:hypothetical protein OKW22_000420 [Bacilli bacterium PM5-3]|nr:hypothetical protein [Bacilli bacterium PM5-3]MDH6603061.1 hypothetical protein [Bacilli bacterium PM5-9]
MKKKYIIISLIIVILIALVYLFKTDFFLTDEQKDEKNKQTQITQIKKTKFASLPIITMDELEQKINNGEDVIAYFGWIYECGDARLFELNSFDKYLDDENVTNKLFVINLDDEALEALSKPELRKPIAKRFQIDTWTKDSSLNPMELKSPQLVHYQNKKIVNLVSWTPLSSDSTYGIREELSKAFFDTIK